MAGLGKKTFAAGEVLRAADVNGYLMDQSVMAFAGTAARGSAVASPSEGMVSYLADSNDVEVYTGSLWQNPAGLTLVASTTFSAAASLSINSCFTTKYDSYKIIVSNYTFTDAGQVDVSLRYRVSGGDISTSNYFAQYMRVYGTGATAAGGVSASNIFTLGAKSTGNTGNIVLDIQNPALSKATTGIYTAHNYQSDIATYIVSNGALTFNATTVFDGFTLLKSGAGTMSGDVKVYGYRSA